MIRGTDSISFNVAIELIVSDHYGLTTERIDHCPNCQDDNVHHQESNHWLDDIQRSDFQPLESFCALNQLIDPVSLSRSATYMIKFSRLSRTTNPEV